MQLKPIQSFFYYRPFADRTFCHFLKQRLTLPEISLQKLFEDFNDQPVTLHQLPCFQRALVPKAEPTQVNPWQTLSLRG